MTPAPSTTPVTEAPTPPSTEAVTPAPTDVVVTGTRGSVDSSSDLSGGAIAGIAAAGAVVAVLALFLARRRRREKGMPSSVPDSKSDESVFTEDSKQVYLPTGAVDTHNSTVGDGGTPDSMRGAPPLYTSRDFIDDEATPKIVNKSFFDEEAPKNNLNTRSVAQYDQASAASIALKKDQWSSTGLQNKIDELDRAIDLGDWAAVYKISNTLSDKDDASSQRSLSTTDSKGRPYLEPEDQDKARQLENLVEKGDWENVAAMAASFTNVSSGAPSVSSSIFNDSESSDRIGAKPQDPSSPRFDEAAASFAEVRSSEDANTARAVSAVPSAPPRRSFKDFVTGSRASSAAAVAMSKGNEDDGIVGASPRGTPAPATVAATAVTVAAAASMGKGDKKKQVSKNSLGCCIMNISLSQLTKANMVSVVFFVFLMNVTAF